MYILAFETSCDDTSVAIMRDRECIALSTHTQMEHAETEGVVPEVAARSHANAIFSCIDEVLISAKVSLEELDFVACTHTPGLRPSLLTGMTVAKMLSLSLEKPLIWVHHIEGHIFANYLDREEDNIPFPNIVLTVSGGHTDMYLWSSRYLLSRIGQTRDDAAGETFDKVAKMLGLGFPGGAKLSSLASVYQGSFKGIFPIPNFHDNSLDFSFSGLKTAVKKEIQKCESLGIMNENKKSEIAYEFENRVIEILINRLFQASEVYNVSTILLAGGVSANRKLLNAAKERATSTGKLFLSPKHVVYSQDNAAMIGIRAYYEIVRKK